MLKDYFYLLVIGKMKIKFKEFVKEQERLGILIHFQLYLKEMFKIKLNKHKFITQQGETKIKIIIWINLPSQHQENKSI